jgi:signal transduction histidine kinase
MSRKRVKYLIGLMSLSLVGIIVIQFLWIENALKERRQIVDHKVYQMIANVEEQLSNYESLAYIASDSLLQGVMIEELSTTLGEMDSSFSGDSLIFAFSFDDSVTHENRMNIEMETGTNSPSSVDTMILREHKWVVEEMNISSLDTLQTSVQQQIKSARTLIQQVKLEVVQGMNFSRLDSVGFQKRMWKACSALGIEPPDEWAIYDQQYQIFKIQPGKQVSWDYEVPLFSNDILEPNRYLLKLKMTDAHEQIWREITLMIVLSIIFMLIIGYAFWAALIMAKKHQRISEVKTNFMNNMTHEFKTPLASISLAADAVLHPKVIQDSEAVQKYLDIIKDEKGKLTRLVELILQAAAMEKNEVKINLGPVSINEVVLRVKHKVEILFSENIESLKMVLTQNTLVNANEDHLENVLMNLVENSVKYSRGKAQILIQTFENDNEIILEVTDQGIGMSKRALKHVFEPFYRVESGDVQSTRGFGLGLNYVRYAVDKMNAEIDMQSEPNHGTKVRIIWQRK